MVLAYVDWVRAKRDVLQAIRACSKNNRFVRATIISDPSSKTRIGLNISLVSVAYQLNGELLP